MSNRRRIMSSPPPGRDSDDLTTSASPSPLPERQQSRSAGNRELRISTSSQQQNGRDEPADSRNQQQAANGSARRHVTISARTNGGSSSGGNRATHRQFTMSSGSHVHRRDSYCPWYERMMPDCLFSLTAPITGYECQLEHRPDIEDHEYEILERERIRRNQRIRRRVSTIVLIASLATAFYLWRGRAPGRTPGVRGALNSMADGLRALPDTMGK